jgi:crossover junction endodeoxyribonuclease RuvC
MTNRLVLGVDPGQTGAIAVLADGDVEGFIDMPTLPRRAGGFQVNAAELAASLRGVLQRFSGAYVLAVLEQVSAMPKQGGASGFRFGQSDGMVRGVLGALRIPIIEVPPQMWKRHLRLTGCNKDAARTLAVQRFPAAAPSLTRKKDIGRADALLIALWAELTEQVSRAA